MKLHFELTEINFPADCPIFWFITCVLVPKALKGFPAFQKVLHPLIQWILATGKISY